MEREGECHEMGYRGMTMNGWLEMKLRTIVLYRTTDTGHTGNRDRIDLWSFRDPPESRRSSMSSVSSVSSVSPVSVS